MTKYTTGLTVGFNTLDNWTSKAEPSKDDSAFTICVNSHPKNKKDFLYNPLNYLHSVQSSSCRLVVALIPFTYQSCCIVFIFAHSCPNINAVFNLQQSAKMQTDALFGVAVFFWINRFVNKQHLSHLLRPENNNQKKINQRGDGYA